MRGNNSELAREGLEFNHSLNLCCGVTVLKFLDRHGCLHDRPLRQIRNVERDDCRPSKEPQPLGYICRCEGAIRKVRGNEDRAIRSNRNAVSHENRSAARPYGALGGGAGKKIAQHLSAMGAEDQ